MAEAGVVHSTGTPGPGTHVLILGVGAYDHLIGGAAERPEIADGMRQLASPPRSARALAEWFLGRFNDPARPLASLAMAVSSADGFEAYPQGANQPVHALPQADLQGVVSAVEGWAERAGSHPDNLAVFYFTGHGVSAAEPLLLCRDFGARQNRFAHAINFESLRAAMEVRAPQHQIYLIDACRTPASIRNLVMESDVHLGDSPLEPGNAGPSRQSVHFATSGLAPTYARREGLSFYTDALIDALEGGGAQSDMDWWVGTNGLQTALGAYTERSARLDDVVQEPERLRAPLFRIHKPAEVRVPLYVSCDPETAWNEPMTLEARSDALQHALAHNPADAPGRREWSAILPPDKYKVAAAFAGGAFEGGEKSVMLIPPSTPCVVQVKARS